MSDKVIITLAAIIGASIVACGTNDTGIFFWAGLGLLIWWS